MLGSFAAMAAGRGRPRRPGVQGRRPGLDLRRASGAPRPTAMAIGAGHPPVRTLCRGRAAAG
eukprot:2015503-Pyramimonas_sp.AAC.1